MKNPRGEKTRIQRMITTIETSLFGQVKKGRKAGSLRIGKLIF